MPTALDQIPPAVKPGLTKMSDKFKEAMEKGSVPAVTPAQIPLKPAEPAKAEPIAEPKAAAPTVPASIVPEVTAPKLEEKPKLPAENFRILEKQRDEFKTQLETTQSKVKELEQKLSETITISPELESTKKQLEDANKRNSEYEKFLSEFHVEHSPEFQKHFGARQQQAFEELKDAVGTEQAAKLDKVLKAPASEWRDEQIEAIAEELTSFRQGALIKAYTDLKRVEKERAIELAKAPENWAKLQQSRADQQKQAQAEYAKQIESAFGSELQKFAVIPDFQNVDGNDEHNARVESNRKLARDMATADLPPAERARLSILAVIGHNAIQTGAIKDALIAKLQKQVADMTAANPSLVTKTAATTTNADKPKGFLERYNEAMTTGIPKE